MREEVFVVLQKCEAGWKCARVPAGPGEIVGKGGVLPAAGNHQQQSAAQHLPGPGTLASHPLG